MKIIIIGAGIACVSAIKAIRLQNKDIKITVYGEETYYPYKRIRLTKDLASGIQESSLLVEKQSWYEENKVTIYKEKKVIRINPSAHRIYLSDGTVDEYTALLLANGASNLVLPIKGVEKENVFTLRNLLDAQVILEQAEKSKKVLMIGGGILGLEIAWSLTKLGKKVTIVEALPELMSRQLDERASAILKKVVEAHGVVVHTGSQVKELTGNRRVEGFITDQNLSQSCEMVIHCTGIRPNIQLVEDTGIQINRGIVVNNRMETNLPDIYAAGDVAEYQGAIPGLWSVASLQGEIAGSNIAGIRRVYDVPAAATVMNAFHYTMFSICVVDDSAADIVLIDQPKENKYRKILFRDEEMIGAVFMGSIKELPSVKRAMENKARFPEVYDRNMQVSDFQNLLQEKQSKKELQPAGAASVGK
ncbi:MAG TPA: NAD(P)/FAD-dependent oxidoreductase [Clostridiales bacterium]|nr:NAD(P)/FAD-dependent oxidoreductase [Clostridiales bacterium]